jgi:hypothetical protein
MQCLRRKVAPESLTNEEHSDTREFESKTTATHDRSERVTELRKMETNDLVRKLLMEEDTVRYLRRLNDELYRKIDERNEAERILQIELESSTQKNKGLEQAIEQLKAETKALKEEMQTLRYDIQYATLKSEMQALKDERKEGGSPSDKYAKLMIAIEPALENMRKCLSYPIDMELFSDPVITSTGHTIQFNVIDAWIQKKKTCPVTNQALRPFWGGTYFFKNHMVRQIIPHFKALELAVMNSV